MPISSWLTFAAVLLLALAVPGPDFVLVVQSATSSLRRGLSTAAGITAGLCLHASLAIAGLATLLGTHPRVLVWLRIAGVAVLIWLGLSMLRTSKSAPHRRPQTQRDRRDFVRGLLTNATNPKALLFFAALLPQFIGTGQGRTIKTALLAATVVLGSALWWTSAVLLIRTLGIRQSPRADRVITISGGLTLVVIALTLAALTAVNPTGSLA